MIMTQAYSEKRKKQILQTQHNIVKNPNWQEADQFTSAAEELNFGLLTVETTPDSGQCGT